MKEVGAGLHEHGLYKQTDECKTGGVILQVCHLASACSVTGQCCHGAAFWRVNSAESNTFPFVGW